MSIALFWFAVFINEHLLELKFRKRSKDGQNGLIAFVHFYILDVTELIAFVG